MSDIEDSYGNVFSSTTLDIAFTSAQTQTTPSVLTYPGALSTVRVIMVEDKGSVASRYDMSFNFIGGNQALCDNLTLQFIDTSGITYDGQLSNTFVSGSLPGDGISTHLYVVEMSLDQTLANTYEGEHCAFSYEVKAWQDAYYHVGGWTDSEVLTDRVDIAMVPPEVPTSLTILDHNGVDLGCGGVTDNRLITVDWGDSSAPDFDHYDYQNKTGVTIAQPTVSSRTGTIADQDGLYRYRVSAVDINGTASDWTPWCEVTLDRSLISEPGDVVINEIMWMGSSISSADEWIELRNTSSHPIDLSNFVLANAGTSGTDITLPSGATIGVDGYYLISNYSDSDVNSALSVVPQFVTTSISFVNTGEQLTLTDSVGTVLDQTPVGAWPAGTLTTEYHSMERNAVFGDGTVSTNWHSCIDAVCNDTTYWDVEGNNYGTPGLLNHSSNDVSVVAKTDTSDEIL